MKRFLFTFCAIIILIFVILLAAEILIRLSGIFQYEYQDAKNEQFVQYNKLNFQGRIKSKGEYYNKFYFNKYGMRGKEIELKKSTDFRILCLGDSFTAALQHPSEYTYPALLDCKLKQNGFNAEVLNISSEGVGTAIEYLYLLNLGLKFKPDLVILAYAFNDPRDDWLNKDKIILDNDSCPVMAKPFKKDTNVILNKSHLYRFQKDFFKKIRKGRKDKIIKTAQENWRNSDIGQNIFAILRDKFSERDLKILNNSFRFLMCLKKTCKNNNIKLALVAIPPGVQVNANEWEKGKFLYGFNRSEFVQSDNWQSMLKEFCRENEIPLLDLLPILRKESKGDLYFDYDGHWTYKGHEIVSEALFNFIKDNSLVSNP